MQDNLRAPKISLLFNTLQAACLLCGILQAFISPTTDNLVATTYVVLGTTVILQYLLRSGCSSEYPITSLALLGLNITSLSASLLTMTAYWRPIVENLRAPEITFPLLASIHLAAVFAHWIYTKFTPFYNSSQILATKLLKPIGLFTTPHIAAVWIMGLIGAFSQFLGHANTGDVSGKAIQALGFLCWMPFLIPFYYKQSGENFCNFRKQLPFIIAFIATMIAIGLARNVRQIMMIGPLQLFFAYYIYLAINNERFNYKTVQTYALGSIALIVSTLIATDLITAMGVARDKRDSGTYAEVIEETMNALLVERHKLDEYRARTELAATLSVYDEAYIPNPILARLSETKFHDNMFYFGGNFISDNPGELIEGMKDRAIATLPENFIKLFNPDYNKNESIYSIGDYYLYLMWGEARLSSFVTGSIWADFYTIFGYWYIFAALPYLTLVYILFNALCLKENNKVYVSAIAICTSWPIFIYGIGGESLVSKAALLAREIPQRIILYAAVFWIIHAILQLLKIAPPKNKLWGN